VAFVDSKLKIEVCLSKHVVVDKAAMIRQYPILMASIALTVAMVNLLVVSGKGGP